MSRRDVAWLLDIAAAIDAINGYLESGDLSEGIVYDACRARLIEIGEAVKGLDRDLLANEPAIPWRSIARMRDHLAHRYFDTDHAIVQDVVRNELSPLRAAVEALLERAREGAE
ncbi:MAG: HepT-like ribonuclease domain-containing protein [Acidimicrobiales bacterium]